MSKKFLAAAAMLAFATPFVERTVEREPPPLPVINSQNETSPQAVRHRSRPPKRLIGRKGKPPQHQHFLRRR